MQERHLSLVKNDFTQFEKKVLPRFPLCYLTFKAKNNGQVYEISDISYTGMQLALKNGEPGLKSGLPCEGDIHWLGQKIQISSTVRWVRGQRAGVEFAKTSDNIDGS